MPCAYTHKSMYHHPPHPNKTLFCPLLSHFLDEGLLCIKCQMLTGLLFSRAFCRPSRVTAGTMGPMEGANWTVGTCICSQWLCGPLECYWPLCGCHGCSWSVRRGGFCHLPPHPPLPIPPHPTSHPTHPFYYQY